MTLNFLNRSLQILTLGFTTAGTILSLPAQANLSISPLVIELDSKQGQAQGAITVGNSGNDSFRARSYAVPFTYDREVGFKELTQDRSDLTPYLQFSPSEVSVPGSDQRRTRFIARLAPSLPDGEYRAMIFTETLNKLIPPETIKEGETTVTTTIIPRMGVAVYVRKGSLNPNLGIESARFHPQDQQVQVLVKNMGKASAIVAGNWTIKQGDRTIANGTIQDTTVIAEGDRYLKVVLSEADTKQLKAGEYQIQGNVFWGVNQSKKTPYKFQFAVLAKN
jgi:hypothetical protein